MPENRTPRLAEWLLARLLPKADRDHAVGDLCEEFSAVRRDRGDRAARRWYWAQVIGAIVPSARRRMAATGLLVARLARQVRLAIRSLRHRPALVVAASGTLGLGVGSAAAMFQVADAVLLRPLPYTEPDRLMAVWNTYDSWRDHEVLRDHWDRIGLSWPEYVDWRDAQDAFAEVAVYGTRPMTLTEGGDPAEVIVGYASSSLFTLLGVRMHRGRSFTADEVGPDAPRLAVLSYELWRDRYGEDPGLIGGSVRLDDMSFQVIGVLPPGFAIRSLAAFGPRVAKHALWLPVGTDGSPLDRGVHSYEALGRLAVGATMDEAADEAARIIWADAEPGSRGVRVAERKSEEVGDADQPLLMLLAAVGLLLLIACANLATLLVGETMRRERELATKAALGAGRATIAGQIGLEGLLLGLAGSVIGLVLARWGVGVLLGLAPVEMALPADLPFDERTLLFTVVLGPLAGMTSALLPGFLAHTTSDLRHGPRGGGGASLGARRWQRILVGGQVAVSLVLLAVSGLLIRSFSELNSVDLGYRPRDVVVGRVTLPTARYESPREAGLFFHDVVERIGARPGTLGVTATSAIPFSGRGGSSSFDLVGRAPPPDAPDPEAHRRTVLPSYHRVLGIPLLEGRLLATEDRLYDAPVIVVSESMANRYWPDGSAVGSRIQRDGREWEIVGVVGDVLHADLASDPLPTFYVPLSVAEVRSDMTLVVRSQLPLDRIAEGMREAVWSLDEDVPVVDIATASGLVARSTLPERFRTLLVTTFAVLATALCAVGLFGVVARTVTAGLAELGVRVALGARAPSLIRHVLGRETPPLAIGLVVGAGGAAVAGGMLSRFLFGISPRDPLAMSAAVLVLGFVGLAAILGACRRVLTVDPVEVIRAE